LLLLKYLIFLTVEDEFANAAKSFGGGTCIGCLLALVSAACLLAIWHLAAACSALWLLSFAG